MSDVDLVEEFRSLDARACDGIDADNSISTLRDIFSNERTDVRSPEQSIGGANLSGILAPDEDDDSVHSAHNVINGTATAAISPSASFTDEIGRNHARGDQLASQEQGGDDDWDSDGGGEDEDADATGRGSDRLSFAVGGQARGSVEGSVRSGVSPTGSIPCTRRSDTQTGSSDGEGFCSNRNMLSPARPIEEGSEWDTGEAESSGDFTDDKTRRESSAHRDLRWAQPLVLSARGEIETLASSAKISPSSPPPTTTLDTIKSELGFREDRMALAVEPDPARSAADENGVIRVWPTEEECRRISPLRRSGDGGEKEQHYGVGSPAKSTQDGTVRRDANEERGVQDLSRIVEMAERESPPKAGSTPAEPKTTDLTDSAVTIQALQDELTHLRQHVLRSERHHELQLRQFDARLEEQERKSRVSGERTGDYSEGAGGVPSITYGTGEPRRNGVRNGDVTPRVASIHNPFAGTGGGVATPRDHFPAFEDALHDGGDDNAASPRREDGGLDEGDGDTSLLRREAFDFSIDTLSHINNHTDFGTVAPVVGPPVTTSALTSPDLDAGSVGMGAVRLTPRGGPWAPLVSPSVRYSGPLQQAKLEMDEGVDQRDRAAEEAFFADALATASLQTPVKHVLANGVSSVGVAVRRVRLDSRSARGTPAERSAAEGSVALTSVRPPTPLSSSSEQKQWRAKVESLRRRPPPSSSGARDVASQLRSRGGQVARLESPGLCMADFFARASAELDDSGNAKQGEAANNSPNEGAVFATFDRGAEADVATSPSEKCGSAGVDAASQTTLSFGSNEEVKFFSTNASLTPLRTLMADERDTHQPGSHIKRDWQSRLPGEQETSSSAPAAVSGGLGHARTESVSARNVDGGERQSATILSHPQANGDRGMCCTPTPRRSNQNPWQTPRGGFRDDCGAPPAPDDSLLFGSPNLSCITDQRKRPEHGGGLSGVDDRWGVIEGTRVSCEDGSTARRDGGGDDGRPSAQLQKQRRLREAGGHSLSPILSEDNRSALSGAGEARLALAVLPTATSAEDSKKISTDRARNSDENHEADVVQTSISSDRDEICPSDGTHYIDGLPLSRIPTGVSKRYLESSTDMTRSSLLRASTTLETIAPLDDDTTGSFSFQSRGGASFPGELFADARMRASETPGRSDAFFARREHTRHVDDGAAPSPRLAHEYRAKSAPTPASEWSADGHARPTRVAKEQTYARGAAQRIGGGVPPAVVGAWLAAAIEGIYGQGAGGGGGGLVDQNSLLARSVGSLDIDPRLARPAVKDLGRRMANQTAPPGEASGAPENAPHSVGQGEDSPPPPPPPLPRTFSNGRNDDNTGENIDEEEMFYQRQHLLQRVVSAAAVHGGTRMPLLSSRSVTAVGDDTGIVPEGDMEVGGGDGRAEISRRHSDPFSWKTPSVAAAASAPTQEEVPAGLRAWDSRGTSSYSRRNTSDYWRERLGMTQ